MTLQYYTSIYEFATILDLVSLSVNFSINYWCGRHQAHSLAHWNSTLLTCPWWRMSHFLNRRVRVRVPTRLWDRVGSFVCPLLKFTFTFVSVISFFTVDFSSASSPTFVLLQFPLRFLLSQCRQIKKCAFRLRWLDKDRDNAFGCSFFLRATSNPSAVLISLIFGSCRQSTAPNLAQPPSFPIPLHKPSPFFKNSKIKKDSCFKSFFFWFAMKIFRALWVHIFWGREKGARGNS